MGLGAYGVVCSANDKKANKKVAIKKVQSYIFKFQVSNAFEDLIDAKRIVREIKLLSIKQFFKIKGFFDHDNIIGILDIIKPDQVKGYNDIYIVTELMETDLHRVIYSR